MVKNRKRGFHTKNNKLILESPQSKIVFSLVVLTLAVLIATIFSDIIDVDNKYNEEAQTGKNIEDNSISFSPEQNRNYIVVALFSTTNELRILQRNSTGSYVTIAQADLPTRIEALAVGDVDNDNKKEIVVGLDGASAPQLRVFRFYYATNSLTQQIVSGVLPNHIEALDVGDADNDGRNEIIVGLEGENIPDRSKVRLYKYQNGNWSETFVSTNSRESIQDVKIEDVDDDGKNEIVTYGRLAQRCPVMLYRKTDSGWTSEDAISPTQLQHCGDRMIIGDADGDGDNEIIRGGSDIYVLDKINGSWIDGVIAPIVGSLDGLAVGYFDEDLQPDIVAGGWEGSGDPLFPGRAILLEWNPISNSWNMTFMTEVTGDIWDADFGDYDNDGLKEVILANNKKLRGFKMGTNSTTILATFPTFIDSVLMTAMEYETPGPVVCGNNIIDQGEQCDDGNNITETCNLYEETCLICNSLCMNQNFTGGKCGDNIIQTPSEECDDGNTNPNDGCDCGGPFYKVFVTSDLYNGSLTYQIFRGLEAGDAICDDLAKSAGFSNSSKWKAWLSNSTDDVNSRFYKSNLHDYRTINNKIIAKNWHDLTDGNIDHPINITEYNNSLIDSIYDSVWTGTSSQGDSYYDYNCYNWRGPYGHYLGFGEFGLWERINYKWTIQYNDKRCDNLAHLYCFEQPWCGNNIIELTEGCDDGNLDSGDGCSSTCQIQSYFECSGQPSICKAICTDSDGGDKPYRKGIVNVEAYRINVQDSCFNTTMVKEYICDWDAVRNETIANSKVQSCNTWCTDGYCTSSPQGGPIPTRLPRDPASNIQ
mgnify:CR=1 FL=1